MRSQINDEDILSDDELDEVSGTIAVVDQESLQPINTLDFGEEDSDEFTDIGLTRSQLVEMNASAETTVRLEEALKDHHREQLQREKAANARKKLTALKNKPDAIAQLVRSITAAS